MQLTNGNAHGKADAGPRGLICRCKINSEAQNLTMTGIQPVQVYGHTAQGASTAQVNAMCQNLKMGTVMGKTQACAISTVAWFFGEKRVPQTATRVEQVTSGSQCGKFSMSTQGAEFVRSGEKGSHSGKETPGRIWSGHLVVAATKRHTLQVATYWFLGNIQIPIGAKFVTRGIAHGGDPMGTCGQSCSS